jgi:hypothetical protein
MEYGAEFLIFSDKRIHMIVVFPIRVSERSFDLTGLRVRARINLHFQALRRLARQDASTHKNVKLFLREPKVQCSQRDEQGVCQPREN